MERDKGFRAIAIIALVIAVAGLSIGYASLNKELTINGTATKEVATWDVKFENLSEPVIVGSAAAKTAAILTGTNVTVDISLIKPGDSIAYTFNVKNAGTIDAKLNAEPVITGLAEAANQKVDIVFTHEDGSAIAANEELAAGASTKLKLSMTFNASSETVSAEAVSLPISTSLFYVQK